MTNPGALGTERSDHGLVTSDHTIERSAATMSAVSWGAIVAGAAGAAALSLILLILGVGLGLSSVSPWAWAGVGATTLGVCMADRDPIVGLRHGRLPRGPSALPVGWHTA
jgi:hypothetical protein